MDQGNPWRRIEYAATEGPTLRVWKGMQGSINQVARDYLFAGVKKMSVAFERAEDEAVPHTEYSIVAARPGSPGSRVIARNQRITLTPLRDLIGDAANVTYRLEPYEDGFGRRLIIREIIDRD